MAEPITTALRAKLHDVQHERTALQSRLAELEQLEQAIQLVIADESRGARAPVQLKLKTRRRKAQVRRKQIGQTPKSALIVRSLWAGDWKALGEIEAEALTAGIDFEGKNVGRSLHFALVGLQRFGYTEKDADNRWCLTTEGRSAAGTPDFPGRTNAALN